MKRRFLHVPTLQNKQPKLAVPQPSVQLNAGSNEEASQAVTKDSGAELLHEGQQHEAKPEAAAPNAAFMAPMQRKPFLCKSTNNITQPQVAFTKPKQLSTTRAPASVAQPTASNSSPGQQTQYFTVLYTKREKLKKKADKGFQDGVLELVTGAVSTLYDSDGKSVSKSKIKIPNKIESGHIIEIGTMAAEIDRQMEEEEFKNGSCFVQASIASGPAAPLLMASSLPMRKTTITRAPGTGTMRASSGTGAAGKATVASAPAQALHDPTAEDSVILNKDQWKEGAGKLGSGQAVVPVVVDPFLCRHLRPHQKEGVTFMYECVMGLREQGRNGCILADEMGLGKTLQVITLSWTLLRQGPQGKPAARKVIVVAPATLVNNWAKEVRKWLGNERLQALVLGTGADGAQKVQDFKHGSIFKMLITSYETVRKHAAELAGSCDLLVCDEGHRLKAAGGNKTINALLQLNCPRRVLLTGTPVQNDLQEFYALISFVTPELLGPMSTFKRVYGDPITRSRDKDATPTEVELGQARAKQLQAKVTGFVLRRTQELLAKHLPPLAMHAVFCRPSQLQLSIYRHLLRSSTLRSLLHGTGAGFDSVLPAITAIRKLCNHPDLLAGAAAEGVDEAAAGCVTAADMLAAGSKGPTSWLDAEMRNFTRGVLEHSGKMQALAALLESIFSRGQRVVVVSTSTATLDLVNALLCQPKGYSVVRIDGATSVDDRQAVVDNFNSRGIGQVFLLSTRAGGAGLNLIGANHLVLYDSDWNPAHDRQAMARIWRDGQTRSCYVYRLLTTGTMEERIYQRQLQKQDLAVAMSGKAAGSKAMSREELKQLFTLDVDTECSSKEMLQGCRDISWLDVGAGELSFGLAAMVGSGVVSSINQERSGMAQQEQEEEATATEAAGSEEGEEGRQEVAAAVPAAVVEGSKRSGKLKKAGKAVDSAAMADGVECLEVEDW